MDFSFSEAQHDVAALAKRILEDKVTVELLREVEAGSDRFDQGTWDALASADLLGIGLPTDVGGSGYGVIEQCLVAEQVGRTVAPVPVVAATMAGAAPVAEFGSAEQRERWASPAARGDVIVTAALSEPVNRFPEQPTTVAAGSGDGWRLSGAKTCVPAGTRADAFLVPASVDGGVAVFVVEAGAAGLRVEPQVMTDRSVAAHVGLDGVEVGADAVLGSLEAGPSIAEWVLLRATVGLCAQQLGVVDRALEMTAAYTKERIQFDRPIATFQAVSQRAADAYVDVEAVRLTTWQAMWKLAEGLPAATELEVAKFWAADAGHRVGHAAVHLHGGTGLDRDHPTHRYFNAAKAIEFDLGGSTDQLLRIGRTFAAARE